MRGAGNVLVHVLVGDRDGRLAGVRLASGEQLVEHDACGVHVAARVGHALLDLLRRQVGGGAHECAGAGQALVGLLHRAGQPEVGHLHPAVLGDEDVLGLDVAVHHARLVGGAQRGQDRGHRLQGVLRTQPTLLLEQVAQGLTRNVLHGQEHVSRVLALVEDLHHVGVGELGDRVRLVDEALHEGGVLCKGGVHDLQGQPSVQP